MDQDTKERLVRLESGQARIEATQAVQAEQLSEIKGTLAQLMPVLLKLSSDVSEIKGRQSDVPTARDFGRLEGRVDALEGRQPVTLAYQTPPQRQTGG